MGEKDLESFIKYCVKKVYLVYIMTSSKTRALRLFNTLNTRGLPLSPADIIKASNLELIIDQSEQDEYAKTWIELENELSRDQLGDLLTYIRTAKAKDKLRKSLDEEYEDLYLRKVLPKGREFIDYLKDMSGIYATKIMKPIIIARRKDEQNRYKLLIAVT
jgi:uncharacterized protein with ParB-like and HNH nuclease domain